MFTLLAALATLAAVGALLVLDPGGVVADSGFPDVREMGWGQRLAWGFRTVGVVVAQLIIIALWLWTTFRDQRGPAAQRRPEPAATPPIDALPAAAVSVLQGHMVWSHTLLASIIEMCRRGTLRLECVGTRVGFLYRLSQQGFPQYPWEQTICDSLPSRPVTIDALDEALRKHRDAIGDQIGDYLQTSGLFHDNPVRAARENAGSGAEWTMLAGALMGVGAGLWTALWLAQWWANALIGAAVGFTYLLIAPVASVVLPTTPRGEQEIEQWRGWLESMVGPAPPGDRDDSMFAYAVALDVAQPWLDLSVPAPRWFHASFLQGADPDAAYRAFLHAPEWDLRGRSGDTARSAAHDGYELELERLRLEAPDADEETEADPLDVKSPETEEAEHRRLTEEIEAIDRELAAQASRPPPTPTPAPAPMDRPPHTSEVAVEKKGGCGCLPGCLVWVVGLLGAGVLALLVLFSLDVVSPRDKPCPLNSPPIPTPAQIAVIGDLVRDECVRVRGTIVAKDVKVLVIEVDRDEYVQRVTVRDPSEALAPVPVDRVITLAGWLRIEEDGTYAVHFVPERSDRDWWRNLVDNLEWLF